MINLLGCIRNGFTASTALTTAFPNGLYFASNPDTATDIDYPRCQYQIISSRHEWETKGTERPLFEYTEVQFDVFAVDSGSTSGADFCWQQLANIETAYMFAAPSISTDYLIMVNPRLGANVQTDDHVWHGWISFQFVVNRGWAN